MLEALLAGDRASAAGLLDLPLPATWPTAADDFLLGRRRDQDGTQWDDRDGEELVPERRP